MSDIKTLIDRVYRTYLEPPDFQPAATRLLSPLGDTPAATSVPLDTFEVPEDINLLRQGSIIEIGSELMRLVSWNDQTKVATVDRAVEGTAIASHDDNARVKLAPPYPRHSVFEAVRDNIVGLYPKLWTTTVEVISSVGPGVFPVTDPLIVEMIEANPEYGRNGWMRDFDGSISEYKLEAGGRAFVTTTWQAGTIVGRFRKRFGVATSEEDTYAELGLEAVWEPVVVVGAAADILSGREIPATHADWVGQSMEAESVPVSSRLSIAVRMQQYRQFLIDRFSTEMKGEDSNKVRVTMNNPFSRVG